MLLLIYPSLREREITEKNCYFLLKLAQEYQMAAIVTRCEDNGREDQSESEKKRARRFGICTDLQAREAETRECYPSPLPQSGRIEKERKSNSTCKKSWKGL